MRISDENRELLNLAAKVIGIELIWDVSPEAYGPWFVIDGFADIWNPLDNDRDALRLAVKLRIDIDNMTDACYCEGEYGHDAFVEIENDDPYAATRRAITIVAAKIARGSVCE